jgi:putative spermidine/putrescine transport system substrate-binding protein
MMVKTLNLSRARLAVAAATFILAAGSSQAADLVVTAYGGIWEQAFRSCYVAEFEKKTGKKVDVVLGGPVQWLNQVSANPSRPPIDVIVNTVDGAADAIKRGVVDSMDASKVPNLKDVDPKFIEAGRGQGTILNYGAMGIAYNQKTVKNPPKDWKEFVDRTVKGEWKASIPGSGYPFTPLTTTWLFAHVYGGGVDNIDPGLAQIKRMRDSGNLMFWNDVNEFLNQIKQGEVDIGMYWDGRTWAFHDDGNPDILYVNPKPGAVVNPTLVQKVKNGSELAWDFINVLLTPEPQRCFADRLQYGMSNTKVTYSPKIQPRITKLDEILWPPFEQMPPKMATFVEQWNKQIGR